MAARTIDVIDVNRSFSLYVGTRMSGYWVGTILSHDLQDAWRQGRQQMGARRFFVEEDRYGR